LLLLFLLFWIMRRRKPTGPAYPPVDQSGQQTRPDQY
jgi:hypothetical protein